MKNRIIFINLLLLVKFGILSFIVSAQTVNFSQNGQIKPVVSETETENPSWKNTIHDKDFVFQGIAKSKVKYYFAYPATSEGKITENWVALPDDQTLSRFSNRNVRLTGKLSNNNLTDFSITPQTFSDEKVFINPPPTAGLHKIVAVPLTIQPISGKGNLEKISKSLTITPEDIRQTFFNAPNSVNNFYVEASYGKLSFAGIHHPQIDVVPVTIQSTISSDCQNQIVSEFTPIVRQRLFEQNIDTTNGSVDLGIIIFNDIAGCPNYPFATRGALGQRGAPLWVWMPESWFITGPAIMAHEMGHALGGNHPVFLRCTNFDDSQTCVAVEADDRSLMTDAG